MTKSELITVSKDVMSGTPVFAGTRVPIQALFDYLRAGDNLDDFLKAFPTVSKEKAQGVLDLHRETLLSHV